MILSEARQDMDDKKKVVPIIMILCHLVCQFAVKIFLFTISQRNSDPNYDMWSNKNLAGSPGIFYTISTAIHWG